MKYPPLHDYSGDTSNWGKHIQRTMELCESSTWENPNTVRIMFYGQSIIGGGWNKHIERWLREKYPSVNFEFDNRAIGGYMAQYLYRTARQDLHPFYPDLMVFHVFGDYDKYEQCIFEARQKTTTEIIIMTNHWRGDSNGFNNDEYNRVYDELLLPKVAEKYQCELVDVRWPWKEYLENNNMERKDLLTDNAHQNPQGKWLEAELCKRQMIYRPELKTEWSADCVKEYVIGEDADFENGKLNLEFEGNRIDLVTVSPGRGAYDILIDGVPPSQHPECWAFTRPTPLVAPDAWTNLFKIDSNSLPMPEDWTLEILEVDEKGENVKFKLTGSVTGPDGEGVSTEPFVSDSGRIAFEPEDWGLARSISLRNQPAAAGMRMFWRSYLTGTDVFVIPSSMGKTISTTVYQGGNTKKHTLELIPHAQVSPRLQKIRIYTPPIPDREFVDMKLDVTEQPKEEGHNMPTPD